VRSSLGQRDWHTVGCHRVMRCCRMPSSVSWCQCCLSPSPRADECGATASPLSAVWR
jgi:hypothetical protein